MKHTSLGLGAILGMAVGCGGAPPPPPPSDRAPPITGATEGPFKADATLQWVADGTVLVIDGHLRFEPGTGSFSPITGARAGDIPLLGPSGERAYLDARQIRVDGVAVELPAITDFEVEGAAGYWVDASRIYVHLFGERGATCKTFAVAEKAWKTPAVRCLDPGAGRVTALRAGPGHLVHTVTEGEDGSDVRILRYDPRQGQGEMMRRLALQADEPLPAVTFTPDGGRARVVSTCDQTAAAGTEAPCGQPPTLYDFDLYDEKQTRVGEVAPGAVPSPANEELAWIHRGALCLGAAGGAVRCYAP